MPGDALRIREVLPEGPPAFGVYAVAEPPHYLAILSILFFALVSGEDADDEIIPYVFVAGEGIIPADEAPGELYGIYRSGVEPESMVKELVTRAQARGQQRYQELHPPAPPPPSPPMPPPRQRQRTRRRSRHADSPPSAAE